MKYITVYHFSAMDEVKQGNVVYLLDKKAKRVERFNDIAFEDALNILTEARVNDDRFVFWKEEKDG